MVDRITCFLTCGYTEAGAMQSFLQKMNDKYDFKQYLPNKTKKKKGDAKTINSDISGLTGEGLLEKIYSIVSKHREEIAKCKAILIEDDLDGRFFDCSESEIEAYKQEIIHKIHENLGKEIPVFILYASPEVESWFVADWENSFEYLYSKSGLVDDLERNIKQFFVLHLKRYIERKILKEYVDDIEEYGWFEGEYVKLSDELIEAVREGAKKYIRGFPNVNTSYMKQIDESRKLYYSKKLHGDRMLRNIRPDMAARKCSRYFGSVYHVIRSF